MKNNSELIEEFLEAKYAEAGLSENSISAYSRDLKKVCTGINKPLLSATQTELEKYFAYKNIPRYISVPMSVNSKEDDLEVLSNKWTKFSTKT